MNHIGQKSIFYIDSQNRTSGTSGNFSINFAMPPNNTYNRIVVMQASVPKSFYLVSDPYNTFKLLEQVHYQAARLQIHSAQFQQMVHLKISL